MITEENVLKVASLAELEISELEIKKYAVIYLTLTDDKNKKPPISSYSKEFNYYSG